MKPIVNEIFSSLDWPLTRAEIWRVTGALHRPQQPRSGPAVVAAFAILPALAGWIELLVVGLTLMAGPARAQVPDRIQMAVQDYCQHATAAACEAYSEKLWNGRLDCVQLGGDVYIAFSLYMAYRNSGMSEDQRLQLALGAVHDPRVAGEIERLAPNYQGPASQVQIWNQVTVPCLNDLLENTPK
jgi:hypothetical protein